MTRLLGLVCWIAVTHGDFVVAQSGAKLDLYWQKLGADIARSRTGSMA